MEKDRKQEEKKRNLNTVEHSIKKRKKKETNIFWKNRQCIDWTKENRTFV